MNRFLAHSSGRLLLAALSLSILPSVLAQSPQGFQGKSDKPRISPPRPFLCGQCPAPLETRSLKVNAKLNPRTAETEVELVLYNPGGRLEESTWIFPLPPEAAVTHFTMMINGEETPAELLDADQARGIYEAIVRARKDPALMEYLGGNLLRVRIFPIEARSEKKLKLTYQEALSDVDSLRRYRYPLGAARLAGDRIQDFQLTAHIKSENSLKTVYSPSHEGVVQRPDAHTAIYQLKRRNMTLDRDVNLLFSSGKDEMAMDLLNHTSGGERYFWLTLSPDLSDAKVVAKDIVLMLDTSGSMSGGKLDQAMAALNYCLANLNPNDRFQLIRFSTNAEALDNRWYDVNKQTRAQASHFIKDFRPMGGTNLDAAMDLALSLPEKADRPKSIILITDGKPTIGETREGTLLSRLKQHPRTRFFCFGIGSDLNTHLLDKLAQSSNARHAYAQDNEDVELKISGFYKRISSPMMTDIELGADGVRLLDMEPFRLPDLYRDAPLHVYGRYRSYGTAVIELSGKVNGKKRSFTRKLSFDDQQADHDFIPRLWANRCVGRLLDQIRLNGENTELVEEVARLAKKHGIVTPYTNFLILEDEAVPQVRSGNIGAAEDAVPEPETWESPVKSSPAKSGRAAVRQSEYYRVMKESSSLEETQRRTPRERVVGKTRYAAGRAFYKKDNLWIEAACLNQAVDDRLTFADETWYALFDANPELHKVLVLGHVRFLFNGRITEVSPL